MNRSPADGLKFETPFGAMFLHVATKDSAIVNVQISHQIKDRNSTVSALIESINQAMRQLCEPPKNPPPSVT